MEILLNFYYSINYNRITTTERSETMLKEILYGMINNMTGADNLEDLPELAMLEDDRKEVEKLIHDTYLEFQAFMEVSDMPDYNLYIKPQRGLELGSVKYVDGEGYNLYISDTLLKESSMKERLFHEFTHIYDKEYLDRTYAYRKGNAVSNRKTHIFTEIHAEQVRYLYMLGCKTVTDEPTNIDHNILVYNLDGDKKPFFTCINNFKSILEKKYYIDAQQLKAQKRIIKRSAIEDMTNKLAYYIGALTVYQRYCSYKVDDVMNLSNIGDFWNINIGAIIDYYCNHDMHRPTMKTMPKIEIANIGDILMHDFICNEREMFTISGDTINQK